MVFKLATAGMVLCSTLILGIAFAQEKKRAPALTTDDVDLSTGRPKDVPADDERLTSPGASASVGTVPRTIAWEHDLQAALRIAADGNRVVVVDVYTDWCPQCKRMDRDIYGDPRVAALAGEAVFLKLNAEDQGEGERFADEHGINGYPTTILMDSSGRPLQSHAGVISPPAFFVQWVQNARRRG